jgi:YfiH family protein
MGNRADADTIDRALSFELPGGARALFTTRAEGNLSTMRGPGHERGRSERERLCAGLKLRWLCASRQVHGATVQRVAAQQASGGEAVAIDADGHATALRELGTMVLVADCLPVIVGSAGAVAALHAGWRGLAGGVLEEGVRALRELGGEGELAAVIGPGARGCCYEVGEEVHSALEGGAGGSKPPSRAPLPSEQGGAGGSKPPSRAPLRPDLNAHRNGRNLDLAAVARDRLEAAGVARVEDVGICTICDERFFSHRREGLDAGRQAGIGWLGSS